MLAIFSSPWDKGRLGGGLKGRYSFFITPPDPSYLKRGEIDKDPTIAEQRIVFQGVRASAC
jgi:hypothetical protein